MASLLDKRSPKEEQQDYTFIAVIGVVIVGITGIYLLTKKDEEGGGGGGGGSDVATIQGTVTDAYTRVGIQGVKVVIGDRFTYSNAQGKYYITDLDPGDYTIHASVGSPYDDRSIDVNLSSGDNQVAIAMVAKVTLSGQVTDSVTHAALSGATISIGSTLLTTNLSGQYSVVLPSGQYTVWCSKDGYQDQSQNITLLPPTGVLSFELVQEFAQTGVVQGTVKDGSNNNPIVGATVTFTGPDAIPHQVVSGGQGTYSIELPASGVAGITYQISVSKSGYQIYSSSVNVRTGTYNTKNISLTPSVVAGGQVAGTVWDSKTGSVIPNADVSISGTSYTAYTNSNGQFVFSDVPPGTYTIGAYKSGYANNLKLITVTSQGLTVVDFPLVPLGQNIGFIMEIEFDPSNFPSAAKWWAEVAGMYANFLPTDPDNPNSIWHQTTDLTTRTWPSSLTVELYDSNDTLLGRRVLSVTMQNGHAYSFYFSQNSLIDLGPF